jgi:hypothetical protein
MDGEGTERVGSRLGDVGPCLNVVIQYSVQHCDLRTIT